MNVNSKIQSLKIMIFWFIKWNEDDVDLADFQ